MSTLLTLERGPRARLVVKMVPAHHARAGGRDEAVELTHERREGANWVRVFGLKLEPGELFVVSDVLAKACAVVLGKRPP